MLEAGVKQGGKAATERDFPANKQLTGLADYSLPVKCFYVFQTDLSLSISFREAEPGIYSTPAVSLESMGSSVGEI